MSLLVLRPSTFFLFLKGKCALNFRVCLFLRLTLGPWVFFQFDKMIFTLFSVRQNDLHIVEGVSPCRDIQFAVRMKSIAVFKLLQC